MFDQLFLFLTCGLAVEAAARNGLPSNPNEYERREDPSQPLMITEASKDPAARAAAIETKRQTFLYGPDPDGSSVVFPSGSLGSEMVQADLVSLETRVAIHAAAVAADGAEAAVLVEQHGGIKNLADFNLLYADGLWNRSSGTLFDAGMQTNYTQDLLFSMERLSINPFAIKRLNPGTEKLPFVVDDHLVQQISGISLDGLFSAGRLFYVNYANQASIPFIEKRYAAGCEAYFYIHPSSQDFLPLAIKTNAPGSNLIYTPLDAPNDWLLAKIAFNQNDVWYASFYHFASTHFKAEVVYMAAIRTLSDDHPVLALMTRVMYQAFAYRPLAAVVLLAPGAAVDMYFSSGGHQAAIATAEYYASGGGAFQANYLGTQFRTRGMIDCPYGPPLKHFPFYDDASYIERKLKDFMTAIVDTFYSDSDALKGDTELQAWLAEASAAHIIDFPAPPLHEKHVLVDILTHMAYLTSVQHHVLNTNDPIAANGQLPFHPTALHAPLPTTKGVTDLMPFLPNTSQALGQVALWAGFARAEFANSDNNLVSMWADTALLARMPPAASQAAQDFRTAMLELSDRVSERKFDDQGLSQGMPFVWRALDPQTAPYFFAI